MTRNFQYKRSLMETPKKRHIIRAKPNLPNLQEALNKVRTIRSKGKKLSVINVPKWMAGLKIKLVLVKK